MPMRMFHGIPPRINQVLKDFLPAELDLIDTEETQAATPDIPAGAYWDYFRPVLPQFPGVRINPKAMTPIDVKPDTFGQRLDAWFKFDVIVDVQLRTAEDTPLVLQQLVTTYTAGIFRVLCIFKEGLQTAADTTRFAKIVTPDGDIQIGPLEEQEGVLVRSGSVPIQVRMIEARA